MACERFREALADVAAGTPARAGLEAHLGSCEGCRTELAALRQALAVADAEMVGLATAEPTPELAVRIRQAVAEASERSPALVARIRRAVAEGNEPSQQRGLLPEDEAAAWRRGWLWPATAAAATLLVALAVVLGRRTPWAPEPHVAVDARPLQSAAGTRAMEPVGEPVAPADRPLGADGNHPVTPRSSIGVPADDEQAFSEAFPGGRQVMAQGDPRSTRVGIRDDNAPTGSRSAGRSAIQAEPEVLVPPGETEALLRFVALVHRDHLKTTSFAAAGQPSGDLAEPASIDIQPLEIVPLDPAESSGT